MTVPVSHWGFGRRARLLALAMTTSMFVWWAAPIGAPPASASTLADTVQFEGGSFSEPLMNKLLIDDQGSLGSTHVAYFDTNLDIGRSDFVSGADDVAVSELPLTSDEASAITSKGGGFAYVPVAASAVALGYALVCFVGGPSPLELCPKLQVNASQVQELFDGAITEWNDPKLSMIEGGTSGIVSQDQSDVFSFEAIDPSASNLGLETYLDTSAGSQTEWSTWATQDERQATAAPSERWPTDNGYDGGDQVLAQQMIPIDPSTNEPPPISLKEWGTITNLAPLPVDWLGPPESIPAMAVQNAAGAFVAPTTQAETAALNDATMDSSNIVTFPADGGTDAAAYPIMEMSYLVVPTKGLSKEKSTALSQFINFLTTPAAANDIESLGAVPPTAAMLKADTSVANEVAAEANPAPGSTTTTTSATTAPSGGSSGAPGSSSASTDSALDSSESATDSPAAQAADAGVTLAYTGINVWPLLGAGMVLAVTGFWGRRRLRRAAGRT